MTTIGSLRVSPRGTIVAILAMSVICATVLIFGGMNTGAGDFNAADSQAGRMASDSSESSEQNIFIAKVGTASVSLAEFKEEVLHQQYATTIAQRKLDGLGTETGMPTKFLEARHRVVLKWGTENAAFGNLVLNLALLREAQTQGFSATDEELAGNIEYARGAYNDGKFDQYDQGYVKPIGEDTYWDEVYPGKAKSTIAINKLHNHVLAEAESSTYRSSKAIWIDFSEATLAKTTILLPENSHHSTSLEDVLAFLADVLVQNRESFLTRADEIPTAPAETWVINIKRTDGTIETITSDVAADVSTGEDEDGEHADGYAMLKPER